MADLVQRAWQARLKFSVLHKEINITHPAAVVLAVAGLVTLVFAGLDRASYSLAYTGLIGAYWVYRETDIKVGKRVAKFQFFGLVVVIVASVYDVAGYDTVPWILVFACWGLCAWLLNMCWRDGINKAKKKVANVSRPNGALVLAVASFVMGVWQAVDSGLNN